MEFLSLFNLLYSLGGWLLFQLQKWHLAREKAHVRFVWDDYFPSHFIGATISGGLLVVMFVIWPLLHPYMPSWAPTLDMSRWMALLGGYALAAFMRDLMLTKQEPESNSAHTTTETLIIWVENYDNVTRRVELFNYLDDPEDLNKYASIEITVDSSLFESSTHPSLKHELYKNPTHFATKLELEVSEASQLKNPLHVKAVYPNGHLEEYKRNPVMYQKLDSSKEGFVEIDPFIVCLDSQSPIDFDLNPGSRAIFRFTLQHLSALPEKYRKMIKPRHGIPFAEGKS